MDSVDYEKATHAAVHAQCKRRHVRKLEAFLSRSKKKLELHPEGQACWVVNLCKRNLTPSQEEMLKMGLNFAPVPMNFPLQDTIAGMEETARKLPKEDADDLRMRVCGILRSSKLPADNITKEQRKALKETRSWKDKVIQLADKGNAMVVMEKRDYDRKIRELLKDTSTYRKLQKDPTPTQESKISRKLISLHNGKEIMAKLYNRLRSSGSQLPRIYGLPKIHKESVPLRPIVSCIGSPSYQLSKSIISPLEGKTSSHVLNSKHFAETMRDITVRGDEQLVSFDSIRPTIKFTMEVEERGSLHFLDTKITRKEDGKLDITKQTHMDRTLGLIIQHVKTGMIRCRARCIVQQRQNLMEEENHFMKAFVGIPVPSSVLPLLPSLRGRKGRMPPTVHLPYVAGMSEWIRRVC